MPWISSFLVHMQLYITSCCFPARILAISNPACTLHTPPRWVTQTHIQGLTSGDSSLPNIATRTTVSCSPILWASSINGTSTELWGWMTPQGAGLEYHTAASSLRFYKRERIRVTFEKNFLTSTTMAINNFLKIPRRSQKGTEPDARLVQD